MSDNNESDVIMATPEIKSEDLINDVQLSIYENTLRRPSEESVAPRSSGRYDLEVSYDRSQTLYSRSSYGLDDEAPSPPIPIDVLDQIKIPSAQEVQLPTSSESSSKSKQGSSPNSVNQKATNSTSPSLLPKCLHQTSQDVLASNTDDGLTDLDVIPETTSECDSDAGPQSTTLKDNTTTITDANNTIFKKPETHIQRNANRISLSSNKRSAVFTSDDNGTTNKRCRLSEESCISVPINHLNELSDTSISNRSHDLTNVKGFITSLHSTHNSVSNLYLCSCNPFTALSVVHIPSTVVSEMLDILQHYLESDQTVQKRVSTSAAVSGYEGDISSSVGTRTSSSNDTGSGVVKTLPQGVLNSVPQDDHLHRRSDVAQSVTWSTKSMLTTQGILSTTTAKRVSADAEPAHDSENDMFRAEIEEASTTNPLIKCASFSRAPNIGDTNNDIYSTLSDFVFVYARWKADQYFYAGRLDKMNKDNFVNQPFYDIRFEDNSLQRTVAAKDIYFTALLPVGTKVSADLEDSGVYVETCEVVKTFDNKFMYEIVNRADASLHQLARHRVALNRVHAEEVQSASFLDVSMSSDVSGENILSSKRKPKPKLPRASWLTGDVEPFLPPLETPPSGKKRILSGKKSTPRRAKASKSKVSALRVDSSSDTGKENLDVSVQSSSKSLDNESPSMLPVRRSPRKSLSRNKGCMPLISTLFSGITVVITTGAAGDDTDNLTSLFDKHFLALQVKTGGGVIAPDFTDELVDLHRSGQTQIVVVSPCFSRTAKFLQGLAVGSVSCVSILWIIDSCVDNVCYPLEKYLHPRGLDPLNTNLVIKWEFFPDVFANTTICIAADADNFKEQFRRVLTFAGANVVFLSFQECSRDSRLIEMQPPDFTLPDNTCPQDLVTKLRLRQFNPLGVDFFVGSLLRGSVIQGTDRHLLELGF